MPQKREGDVIWYLQQLGDCGNILDDQLFN